MKKIPLLTIILILLLSSCDGYLDYSGVDIGISLFVDEYLSETNDEYGAVASIYNYMDDRSVSDAVITVGGIEMEYSESAGNYYFPYGTLLSLNPGDEIKASVYHPKYGTRILETVVPDNPDTDLNLVSNPPLPDPGTENTADSYTISIEGESDRYYSLTQLRYSGESRNIENDEGSENRLVYGNSEETFSGESMKTKDGILTPYLVFSVRNYYTSIGDDSTFSVESLGSIELTNCR